MHNCYWIENIHTGSPFWVCCNEHLTYENALEYMDESRIIKLRIREDLWNVSVQGFISSRVWFRVFGDFCIPLWGKLQSQTVTGSNCKGDNDGWVEYEFVIRVKTEKEILQNIVGSWSFIDLITQKSYEFFEDSESRSKGNVDKTKYRKFALMFEDLINQELSKI